MGRPHRHSRLSRTLAVAGSLACLAFGASAAQGSQPGADVLVRFDSSAAAAAEAVRAHGGQVERTFALSHAIEAKMAPDEAAELRAAAGIVSVSADAPVRPESVDPALVTTDYGFSVEADASWAEPAEERVGVALVDTGFSPRPGDFGDGHVAVSVNPETDDPNDYYGHGTHLAGLIAGNGNLRAGDDPLRGRYVGVAPETARIVSIKISDDEGNATVGDVIAGIEYAVRHRAEHNIRVLNLSLNSSVALPYWADPLDAAVEAAWRRGITVVVAAGNQGGSDDAVDHAPANDPYVVTVGATDEQGTRDPADDKVASWSSFGTTDDGFAKPEVVAPGAHIVSTFSAKPSYFGEACPSCVRDGDYFQISGTSLSAPIVAGVAASLVADRPKLSPDQVKHLLAAGARELDEPEAKQGAGEVSLAASANLDQSGATRQHYVGNPGVDRDGELQPIDRGLGGMTAEQRASWREFVDAQRASWRQMVEDARASWREYVEANRASWSRASWSRASWRRASWSDGAEDNRASWSRASWSRASWSRASWSRASWSQFMEWQRASWRTLLDFSRASWSTDADFVRASWSDFMADVVASRASWSTHWERASWSTLWERASWSAIEAAVEQTRASWSRASWSRASWSRASWSKAEGQRASWSDSVEPERASWSVHFNVLFR